MELYWAVSKDDPSLGVHFAVQFNESAVIVSDRKDLWTNAAKEDWEFLFRSFSTDWFEKNFVLLRCPEGTPLSHDTIETYH